MEPNKTTPRQFGEALALKAHSLRNRILTGAGFALAGVSAASAQETGSSGVDAAVTSIIDTIKASLNTTVGKAMTIGVILLLAVASWRAIKRMTS